MSNPLDCLESAPLVDRLAPALVWLGLARRISWEDARYVLDAVTYFDERDAARWRRTEELIAAGGLR